ncbi:MAG: hypothetical protein JXA54_12680 [Candidatus Heimdallarchaeota archaeon]|nr:hypothetical protein [Candidatus Heimdallarchaeota archaeon]
MYRSKSENPKFTTADYKTKYNKPCIPEDLELDVEMVYYGTGVDPKEHPLRGYIRFNKCENCSSDNVNVIYARWCVSTHSGNSYWDYELICEDCNFFSQCSFAEND